LTDVERTNPVDVAPSALAAETEILRELREALDLPEWLRSSEKALSLLERNLTPNKPFALGIGRGVFEGDGISPSGSATGPV
jgi:hypothetical protein